MSKIIKYAAITFSVLICLGFIFRENIANKLFLYETKKIQNNYGLAVNAQKIEYIGLRTIQLTNLSVSSIQSDTLLNFGLLKVKLSIFNLLILKINPLEVTIKNSSINVQNVLHYKELIKSRPNTNNIQSSAGKQNVSNLNRLIKSFFGLSTARFNVDNFTVNYKDSASNELIILKKWKYSGNTFNATALFADSTGEHHINIIGFTDKQTNIIDFKINGVNGIAKVPFIEPFLGFSTLFDSARFSLQAKNLSRNNIELVIKSITYKLQLQGKRIAESSVQIDSLSANLILKIDPYSYSIDSLSSVGFNKLMANIGASYNPTQDSTFDFQFKTYEYPWQDLIESLPKGLFNNIKGMQLKGKFKYRLDVKLNINNPDSIKVEPQLSSKGFYVQSYGNSNFTALNDTFTHKVYNNGLFVKSMFIGNSNKEYVPLDKISPFLRWAIITSEDGSFYNHRGFDLDGIRYAMACNIKEKRFARGGSTITQQLIKNLYLSKNKNITRKFEELLIVWMIENGGLVSKDRMLEIYLNIIEWGPNIYGVSNACKYYFDKTPDELTLQEALFLASIVPRPTKFKYMFEDQNHLKPFMLNGFDFVSQKMLNRNYITVEDYGTIQGTSEFKLSGDALKVFSVMDTLKTDSIDFLDFTQN